MTTPELSDDELWELRDWSDQDKSFPSTTIIRLLDEHARLKEWVTEARVLMNRAVDSRYGMTGGLPLSGWGLRADIINHLGSASPDAGTTEAKRWGKATAREAKADDWRDANTIAKWASHMAEESVKAGEAEYNLSPDASTTETQRCPYAICRQSGKCLYPDRRTHLGCPDKPKPDPEETKR